MPVSYIPSAEHVTTRQKQTARKRRRNQNTEIDELAGLLPIKQQATSANSVLPPDPGKSQNIDKISVLRITSAFLKFQKYLEKDQIKGKTSPKKDEGSATDLLSEALDGFLLVLDKEGTILFVSEAITTFVGLTQHDVIGQNLADITDEEDATTITENLLPKTTPPPTHLAGRTEMQHRQFFIRIKSTVTPGRMQLSRFKSQIMIQVSGSLKVHVPFQSKMEIDKNGTDPRVLGFVGECRPIESSSSILEVSIPQSHFTSTINLDLKIISVEASIKDVVGYNPDDFVGTRMSDYFHPGDCKSLIPCEKMLMNLGHAVSPVFRFMSSSGDWVWMQLEGMLRYKPGTDQAQFWEVKAKLLSQDDGRMKFIEYRELYAKNFDPNQNLLCPHKDPAIMSCLLDSDNECRKDDGPQPIIDTLTKAQVSSALIDPVLHGREIALSHLPGNLKRALTENEADDFVIERNKRFGWPIPENLLEREKFLEQKKSKMESLQTAESVKQNVYPDPTTVVKDNISSTNGNSSLSSPLGSGLDDFTPSISPPLPSLTSPPNSIFSTDQTSPFQQSPGSLNDGSLANSIVSPPSVQSDVSGISNTSSFQSQYTHIQPQSYNTHTPQDNVFSSTSNYLSNTSGLQAQVPNTFDSNFQSNTFSNYVQPVEGIFPNNSFLQTQQNGYFPQPATNGPQSSHPSNNGGQFNGLSTQAPPVPSPISQVYSPQLQASSNVSSPQSIVSSQTQVTQDDSLEQILSEMIELNSFPVVDDNGSKSGFDTRGQETISVQCEVHTSSQDMVDRGYMDSGISISNSEVDDIIQQFM